MALRIIGDTPELASVDTLSYRRATAEDAEEIAKLYDTVYEGKYPLLDYVVPARVAAAIGKKYVWHVACDLGRIVGSAVAIPEPNNLSFEIGRTVILPDYRSRRIAKTLCEGVRDEALANFDVGWANVRNEHIYKISLNDGLVPIGYSSPHRVKKREVHLLSMRLTEDAKKRRRIPTTSPEIYDVPKVGEILESMGLSADKEEFYPSKAVYTPRPTIRKGEFHVGMSYHQLDRCAVVTYWEDLIDHMIDVEYFETTLLADKTAAMKVFRRLGFEVTAFMPGWAQRGVERYDCVKMVNSRAKLETADAMTTEVLEDLVDGFRDFNDYLMEGP